MGSCAGVRETGQWLKSIVQVHFNYYAVPHNIESPGVFRDRLVGHWRRTLRRRSRTPRMVNIFSGLASTKP